MFTDDADRLAFIKGLGGQLVRIDSRPVWAVFRLEPSLALDGSVESYKPTLELRTVDIQQADKDSAVVVGSDQYRLSRTESDESGFSTMILKR